MSFERGAPALWFVEIFLDDQTLRHCNAFEAVTFDGETYSGIGDRLTPPPDIDRAASLKSQKFTLRYDSSRQTDNTDPIGIILDARWRRRPIRVRHAVGAMSASGYDFSDPFIIADEAGRIRNIEDKITAGRQAVLEMEVESGALIFLERKNQTRSPANQRAAFESDAFFDFTARLDGVVIPWRTKHVRTGTRQIQYEIRGVATRELLIGRGATKGSFVFGCTVGQQRKFWNQVYALADHQCERLEEIFINGTPVLNGITLSHGVKTALQAFRSHESGAAGIRLWVTWYDGRHDQTADSYLITQTAAQPFKWTSAHRGRGVSYVIIEHAWDSDNPEDYSYEFIVRGARVYQERKDTTAGGSGSHRLDDPGTWEYTTNPEEALRHFLLGRVVAPSNPYQWFGVGAPRSFLETYAEYAARAAGCDELEPLKAGGTQKRFEANGWIRASEDHKTNLQRLADCMVADVIDEGGRIKVRLSDPQTPVIELFDDDLVEDEDKVIGANARADDVVNRIEGRYVDSLNRFALIDYKAISNPDFVEVDGEEITGTWNQELEISEERAQRKATLYLNKQRRTVELEEHFGTKAKDVRPGDWLTRSSAVRGFPDGKLFIADEVRRYVDGTVRLILLEVDPDELVWVKETAELNPFFPEPEDLPDEVGTPDISLTAVSITSGSVILPGITIVRSEADDLALGVEVEIALSDGSGSPLGVIKSYNLAPGGIEETITGLLPSTEYIVRLRYSDGQRRGDWTAWHEVTTTEHFQAATAGAPAPDSALSEALDIAAAAREGLAELVLSLNVRIDETRRNVSRLMTYNGAPLGQYLNDLQQRIESAAASFHGEIEEVTSRLDEAAAALTAVSSSVTALGSSTASSLNFLNARIGNTETLIGNETTARTTADEALGNKITGVTSRLAGVESGVTGNAAALANLSTRVTNTENSFETLSSSLTNLSSSLTSQQNTLTGQASALNALSTRVASVESVNTFQSSTIVSLQSELSSIDANLAGFAEAIGELQAQVIEVGGSITVDVSDITSLSAQISALSGSVLTQATAISGLTTRVSNAEGQIVSLSNSITTLSSGLTAANGNISAQSTAISSLTTRVSNAEGQLSSQATAITSLTASLGGVSSSLTEVSEVVVDLNGRVEASWGLILDVNGRVSAARAFNDGEESEFSFLADSFKIYNGDTDEPVFEVADDKIFLNGVVVREIESQQFTGSNTTLPSNASQATILLGTVTTQGAGQCEFEFEFDLSTPQTVGCLVEVLVNGVVKRLTAHYCPGPFTHTLQAFARFSANPGDIVSVRAKAEKGAGIGQAGVTVTYVTGRLIRFSE